MTVPKREEIKMKVGDTVRIDMMSADAVVTLNADNTLTNDGDRIKGVGVIQEGPCDNGPDSPPVYRVLPLCPAAFRAHMNEKGELWCNDYELKQ